MLSVERLHAKVRRPEQMDALFGDGWPAFITADRDVKLYLDSVRARHADLELVVLDDAGVPVATGWAVPIRWDSSIGDLPTGYTDSLRRTLHDTEPNTLVIMGAQVHPELRGRGLAGRLLLALRDLAGQHAWANVIAPVRPTLKARYPLTPIDRFARWLRPDGTPLDPWLRTHHKVGARTLATAPASQTMTGTVDQWEDWTGLRLPESGAYVIPDGLSTLQVDTDSDTGTYVEPNVWMQHL